jgi:serine/threonine-protein kinase
MPQLPLVGEEFAGYRLTAVLGRGGMSIVFRAENPRLGNVIALKVLDPSLATDDVFRTRFLEESRIAASMNHPNVIPIHDMGSSDGLLYIAMRCVTGTDLRQMLKKRGRLQPDTSVFLLEQAARALDAAHRRGLVHRDVKPGNLLIERGNDGSDPDHLYLADFGITKHLGGRTGLTSTGQFLGTIDYVAPEQIRGTSVLGFADQYSLGCVLYECLTGRVPFEKDLDAAIIWAHVEETPTRPTVLRPDLPLAIDDVFGRVLAKRPGDRYQTCKEFMSAARDALGHMAELPGPDGTLRTLPPAGPDAYLADARYRFEAPPEPGAAYPYRPAELAHETAGAGQAQTSSWPVVASSAPPPLPSAGRPLPPPGGGRRAGGVHRRRPRLGLLAGIAALIVVAGAAVAVTMSLRGNNPPAAAPTVAGAPTSVGMSMPAPLSSGTASSGANPAMTIPVTTTATTAAARTAYCAPGGTVYEAANNHGTSGPTSLAGVLQLASLCASPEGILPAKSCKDSSATTITCTAPVKGVASVTFQTFATTAALYTQYENQIRILNGSFTANTKTTCGNAIAGYAETGWNHLESHPTKYTVAQMESASFNQIDAMGRQACFIANGTPYMVWTTDVGNMLGVITGNSTMNPVYNWWANIHHVIIFPGTWMCGQTMGRMGSVPQGNLISATNCPTGALPATPPPMSGM